MPEISDKIKNTNEKILKKLKEILKHCEKHGHQPEKHSEDGIYLRYVANFMESRKRKNISTPNTILDLYAKIRNFPTFLQHQHTEELFQQAKQKMTFERKYKQIQELTPYSLEIFKFISESVIFEEKYDKQLFNYFINTDIDIMATKAFLEYFYKLYFEFCRPRTHHIILLYTGTYGNPNNKFDDYTERQSFSEPNFDKEIINKYNKHEPLTLEEIGKIFHLSAERVRVILGRSGINLFSFDLSDEEYDKYQKILDLYLSGNANAVLSEISSNAPDMYKYQKNNNLQNIPTDIINQVGKKMLSFFKVSKTKD